MRHAAASLALAAVLAACAQPAPPPAADAAPAAGVATTTTASKAVELSPDAAAPVTAPTAAGAGGGADTAGPALDFRGDALAWMQANAKPAPQALVDVVRAKATTEAAAEDCRHWAEGDRAFAADLDGDGRDEGIAFYTIEACGGGGNNYVRILVVMREDGARWAPTLDVALGTKLTGNRAVTAITTDGLTLAGSGEPFDSEAAPQALPFVDAR